MSDKPRITTDAKSSILKAIAEHLDTLEASAVHVGPLAARDLYSKNQSGDHYSKNTQQATGATVTLPAELVQNVDLVK